MKLCCSIILFLAAALFAQDDAAGSARLGEALDQGTRLNRMVLALFVDSADAASQELAARALEPSRPPELSRYWVVTFELPEHRAVADRYQIRLLPAALLLDGVGQVRARQEGVRTLPEVIALAESGPTVVAGGSRIGELLAASAKEGFGADGWTELALAMGQDAFREPVRETLLGRQPFPRQELVALLDAPRLAVRSGALDALEEVAGTGFGFDPWHSPTENAAAVALWREWAGQAGEAVRYSALTDEEIKSLLAAVLAGDRASADRARERLVRAGASTLAAVARYENEHPDLSATVGNQLRELRYGTILAGCPGLDGARIARQLVVGDVTRQLDAVRALIPARERALPILQELLQAQHALVRETAADALGSIGGPQAVALLATHVQAEANVDVLVAVAARLGKIRTRRSHETLCLMTKHAEEDVVIAALRALAHFERSVPLPDPFWSLLGDPRWRVRTAALEALSECGNEKQKERLLDLVADSDPFVRATAAKLFPQSVKEGQADRLQQLFRDQPDLRPALVTALAEVEEPLTEEQLTLLENHTSPDALQGTLAAWGEQIDRFLRNGGGEKPPVKERREASQRQILALIGRLTRHPDSGVRRAAAVVLGRGIADAAMASGEISEQLAQMPAELWAELLDEDSEIQVKLCSQARRWRQGSAAAGTAGAANSELTALRAAFLGQAKPTVTAADLRLAFLGGQKGQETAAVPPYVRVYQMATAALAKAAPDSDDHLLLCVLRTIAGEDDGMAEVVARLDELSEERRGALISAIPLLPCNEASRKLLMGLQAQAEGWPRETLTAQLFKAAVRDPGWGEMLLEMAGRPDSGLDVEGITVAWRELEENRSQPVQAFARRLGAALLVPDASVSAQVVGVFLRAQVDSRSALGEPIGVWRKSPNPLVRRAAWQALIARLPEQFSTELAAVLDDPSPVVRALPLQVLGGGGDRLLLGEDDYAYVSWRGMDCQALRVPDDVLLRLVEDPDPGLRCEAMLALDARGTPPVQADLLASLRLLPEKGEVTVSRLASGRYMGDGRPPSVETAATLLEFGDKLSEQERKRLRLIIAGGGKLSPQQLRQQLYADDGDAQGLEDPVGSSLPSLPPSATIQARSQGSTKAESATGVVALPKATGCKVVVFYRVGCRDCRQADALLQQATSRIPGVEIERWNIREGEAMRRNEALCRRFGVEDRFHLVAPAIFAAAGALVGEDIELDRLVRLLLASREAETPGWDAVAEPELAAGETTMLTRFAAIRVGVVLGSGLLDGVNPCAFATVVFLLSYLQLRHPGRRQLWQVGLGFVLGVFATYYVLGLGLAELLERLSGLGLAGRILNGSLAALAAVLVVLNLRDGVLCLRGRMGDMVLQLPGALKRGIHSTVRRGTRMVWLLPAAVAMGALVSVLELACTGQVYAPTILYILRSGVDRWRAAWLLLLYNLAFVLPLIVVFVAAVLGVGNARFTAWLQRHAATVKFATAGLFLVMLLALVL